MAPHNDKDLLKVKKLQGLYNMIPNLIWSALNLVPVSVFCYNFMELKLIYIFLGFSIIPIFLPNSFFNKIQFSNSTTIYKKLGVGIINKVAQNGDIVNWLIRKQFPGYRVITFKKSSVSRLLQQTYLYEKFHFILFIFFSLTTIYSLGNRYFIWSVIISITNLAYNVYPNLLQQYIRIKLILYNKESRSV